MHEDTTQQVFTYLC